MPLHLALDDGAREIIELLLDAGAKVDIPCNSKLHGKE
jgi:ankyrin repeat protein